MEINTNINADGVNGAIPPKRPAATRPVSDGVSLSGSTALDNALQSVPATRPEAVARATALISDVNYPPQEIIKKLAVLLAIHLDP